MLGCTSMPFILYYWPRKAGQGSEGFGRCATPAACKRLAPAPPLEKKQLQMRVIVGALLSVWQAHPKPSALEKYVFFGTSGTEHHQDGFLSRDSFKTVRRTDTIIARYPTWPAPPHPKASVPLHTRPACVVGPPPEDAGLD